MKKLLLLGIPLVTLAGLNVWSQAVAGPAHIQGPGIVVRDVAGPDLAADFRAAEIPAAPAESLATTTVTSIGTTTAKKTAKDPAATRAAASVREPATTSPAPPDAGSLDRITVFVPAAPTRISSHDAADDGGTRGRRQSGKSEGSRSGHHGGSDDN
jgi:hypothetical protein